MALSERFGWLILGMAVGFVLGLIVARLRDIKEEVDEIDNIVRGGRVRDESGFMRIPIVADVLYLTALVIVVWGAFSAQQASNKVEETQKELARVSHCTQDILADTVEALNERTEYTGEQASSNVELQGAQYTFLAILLDNPPPTDQKINESLRAYVDALGQFVEVNTKAQIKVKNNPYPTSQDYESCLEDD